MGAAAEEGAGEDAEAESGGFCENGENEEDEGGGVFLGEGGDGLPEVVVEEEKGENGEDGEDAEDGGGEEGKGAGVPVGSRGDGESAEEVGFVFDEAVFEADDGAGEDVANETDGGGDGEGLEGVVENDAGDGGEIECEAGGEGEDEGAAEEVGGEFVNPEEVEFE